MIQLVFNIFFIWYLVLSSVIIIYLTLNENDENVSRKSVQTFVLSVRRTSSWLASGMDI